MQRVVIDEPYEFIPPIEIDLWPSLMQLYLPRYLRKTYCIETVECRHTERLRESVDAGHGILMAPNHCRLSDPMVLGILARRVRRHLFAMASWHLFKQDWFTTFMIRRMGAFSVYREGLDRAAIGAAIDILVQARRPLVVFPEGAISRHNDQLMALMEGTAFIARSAAKRRAKRTPEGKVVVHPVAIRYYFHGNLEETIKPVLDEIESHFSWMPQREKPLLARVRQVGEALLSLKEVEFFGHANEGDLYQRVETLIDHLLLPLEEEWKIKEHAADVVGRVKNLRAVIVPDMVGGELNEEERVRRWRQLYDVYLAQQLSHYPRDYVTRSDNLRERVLETVERFEEDLTNEVKAHGPMHVVIEVGEAIEVSPQRDRKAADPVMLGIETQLSEMLGRLASEAARE